MYSNTIISYVQCVWCTIAWSIWVALKTKKQSKQPTTGHQITIKMSLSILLTSIEWRSSFSSIILWIMPADINVWIWLFAVVINSTKIKLIFSAIKKIHSIISIEDGLIHFCILRRHFRFSIPASSLSSSI